MPVITAEERMKILKKLGKDKNQNAVQVVQDQEQDRITSRKSLYKSRLLDNISLQQDSGLLKEGAAQKAREVIERQYS